MRRWHSLLAALVAGLLGLALWGFDDLLVVRWLGADHPLHKATEIAELVFLCPGLAALAWLVGERLRQQQERLRLAREQRFAGLGKVAAAIAHEVRNPLHTLGLMLDELRGDGRLDAAAHDDLRRHLARIAGTVTQVYALARPPQGDEPAGDLAAAARAAAACHPGTELAPLPAQAAVDCPDGALAVILDNLLRNALAAGGRAAVAVQAEAAAWRLAVRNPGLLPPGVAGEGDDAGAVRSADGLGLGLFIARQLAVRAGGALALRQEGGEVVAVLDLPVREAR